MSGNSPPNLVCLYICLHFNDKENEIGAQKLGADTILLGEESKPFAVTITPVVFKVLFAFSKCKSFFFFFFPSKMLNAKIPLLPCTPDRNGLNGASGLQGRF